MKVNAYYVRNGIDTDDAFPGYFDEIIYANDSQGALARYQRLHNDLDVRRFSFDKPTTKISLLVENINRKRGGRGRYLSDPYWPDAARIAHNQDRRRFKNYSEE